MANNYAQQQGVDTSAYANLAHHAVESKNVNQALQNQMGNDVMNYAHEKAYQHMQGGKIRLPKIHISNATKKGFSDFGHGFVKGFTGTMKNPIVQGVATNLITGALMGGAGKPKRLVKGSAEANAHISLTGPFARFFVENEVLRGVWRTEKIFELLLRPIYSF